MAVTIIVLHNQSLLDVAIQHTGSVDNAFAIAKENGLAVSDVLTPGTELIIPNPIENDSAVLNYYSAKEVQPATALTEIINEEIRQRGIGYMQIGRSFKVSKVNE